MRRRAELKVLSAVVAVCVTLLAAPAFAQAHAGIRAGLSSEPSQLFFGGHVETSPLIEHVTFRPNAEIGIGDDVTLVALNFEFAYSIPINKKPARVYLGAGPSINIASHDTGGGFNVLVGVQHNKGLFGELKVGFADSPELKVTVGYAFK